ncbi:MAG TPA: putative porin [Alphaproteobacteria bacterium]|nr:putative porin [Alphaproteobacteria bacterium]
MRKPTYGRRRPLIDRYLAGSLLAVAATLAVHQARAQTAPTPAPATAPNGVPVAAANAQSAAPAGTPAAASAKPTRPVRPIQPVKTTAPAAGAPAAPPSQSVVINLIRLLVQEGVLTQDKANALIRQAQDEAAAASRGQPALVNAPPGTPKVAAAGQPQSVRVPYIPEVVRKQIRDEVKQEVLAQAKAENWAAPDQFPDWVKSVRISGDFRLRYEWDVFDKRNANTFLNFNTLNAGSPFDLNNLVNAPLPFLDTTQDRQRLRERFRLGIGAQIDDEWAAGLRLATGNTPNPVSTNQTLGNSLSNDSFNLDRAFIRYQPTPWVTAWLGRMPDPWFATDLVFDDDLNFDGVAVQLAPRLFGDDLRPSLVFGAFPIGNTPFNGPDNSPIKHSSRDVWLYAAQGQADWRPDPDYEVRVGLAYYIFNNINGQMSSPCAAVTASQPCDTDFTRPGFLQQGNTLFALRNLVNQTGTTNPTFFEYYGLASEFHELNLTTRFDYAGADPVHFIFDADFVKNLGFHRASIAALSPVNNQGPSSGSAAGPWDGGDSGYLAKLTIGYPVLRDRWNWNFNVGYKYLESDAVVDAFTDSDFHLGGTNAKGYFVGGGLSIAKDIDLSARWLSAREVTGPAYSVDVIQVDLNGRF